MLLFWTRQSFVLWYHPHHVLLVGKPFARNELTSERDTPPYMSLAPRAHCCQIIEGRKGFVRSGPCVKVLNGSRFLYFSEPRSAQLAIHRGAKTVSQKFLEAETHLVISFRSFVVLLLPLQTNTGALSPHQHSPFASSLQE